MVGESKDQFSLTGVAMRESISRFSMRHPSSKHALIWLMVVLACLWSSTPVPACPACNIFNYLETSVRSSTEIIVAKVVKATGDDQAQVEVVRVIKGPLKKGQVVERKLWKAERAIGRTLIFCNPTSWPPNFEELPADLEEEVAWLVATASQVAKGEQQPLIEDLGPTSISPAERASIKNVETALRRVQGISNTSRQAGLDWLKAQRNFPSAQIRTGLRSAHDRSKSKDESSWLDYRQGCLVEALMLSPIPKNQKFVRDEVEWCLHNLGGNIVWTNFWDITDWPAPYLSALVNSTSSEWKPALYAGVDAGKRQELKELRQTLVKRLMATAPTLKDGALAQVVWSLSEWDMVPAKDLAELAKNQNQKDAVALGLYLSSRAKVGMFTRNEGLPTLQVANELTQQPELKEKIESRLKQGREKKETQTP